MKKSVILIGKKVAGAALLFLGLSQPLMAAPKKYEFIDNLTDFVGAAGLFLILLIAIVAFIWIGWMLLAKFNDARKDRAEWGEVGLLAVVAAGVLVIVGFVLGEANDIIDAGKVDTGVVSIFKPGS